MSIFSNIVPNYIRCLRYGCCKSADVIPNLYYGIYCATKTEFIIYAETEADPDITPASVKKLLNVYKDTKDGRRIALTDFNGYNDVTVKYEDGEALEHIRFKDYRKSLAKN